MCLRADIASWPHKLPDPNNIDVRRNEISGSMFYLSIALKDFWEGEMNKTKFSRMVGAIVYPGGSYMVYNSRDTLMKWSGNGESKVQSYLSVALAMSTAAGQINSAILFGDDYLVALRTLEEAQRRRRYDLRFDNVYRHIHFIPLNEFGIKHSLLFTLYPFPFTLYPYHIPPNTKRKNANKYSRQACNRKHSHLVQNLDLG